ncbi:right-handed parallel beta-helix repeat-containing protein [Microbacterium sp. Se5.02b]|uniref:right-handed parallel beta-helix repeat-containing protein n=1 Tax=Microbacterium sp. Se5.02b TaxID=2864103 RepID=UPI001C68DE0F|nr:right-handed parallel beta-helix repeat-containing protein [Microbacterium sp. Se5.02b]QYM64796.1 right-handed parallel beta-helix repeat-containing protein [Microbacterium sp. Se5.02b]
MSDPHPTITRRTLLVGTAVGAGGAALAAPATAAVAGSAGAVGPVAAGGAPFRKDFPVSSRGAVPGQPDSGPAIRQTIADAAAWTAAAAKNTARVLFAPGTYRVGDDGTPSWYAIELTETARIALVGDRTEILLLDPHKGGIAITRSTRVSVSGITLDYETPPFTQGVIRAVDPDTATFQLELLPGFPSLADRALFGGAGYGTLHDAATGLFKRGVQSTFAVSYPAAPDADGRWTFTVDPAHRGRLADIAVGDGFATGYRGDRNGIALHQSVDTTLEDLVIHAAPGAAVISNNSEATVLRRSTVDVRAGSDRWISTNADGYHHHGGRRGPTVTGNRFARLHDDGMNVYSQLRALDALSAGGTALHLAGGSAEVAVGDTLQIVRSSDGTVRGTATVTAVQGDPRAATPLVVTVASVVPGAAVGDHVFNRSYSASGFTITDNTIEETRGLGVRMKASNGVISGNRLSDLTNWGIWIANDTAYGEGPIGSENLVVTGNVIRRICLDQTLVPWPSSSAAIMLQHFTASYTPGVSRVHRNIAISDNTIEDAPRFGVYLGAATNATAAKTAITVTAANPRSDQPSAHFGLENLKNGLVIRATIADHQSPPRAAVWRGPNLQNTTVLHVPGA